MFGQPPPPQRSQPKLRRPAVMFQPATYRNLQQGINQMVNAIRPTLGPQPRLTVINRITNDKGPEILDDGGTIARRIIQLKNRNADVGAMFVRQLLWHLHEQVGDGTATAAVMFQTLFNEGIKYITSGGNAAILHNYLQQSLRVIDQELAAMTMPIEGKERLAQIAQSICYDPPLAKMMGEVFDIIGEHGRLELRTGQGRELEREYVEGIYWEKGVLSRAMLTDPVKQRTDLENAAILISDLEIEEPDHLMPTMLLAVKAEQRAMVVIASKLSDKVLGFLHANNKPDKFQVIAVGVPGVTGTDQAAELQDLAVLTGGRPFLRAAGDTLRNVLFEDLGQARRAWADRDNFGIIGGKGDPRQLRQHIATLRAAFKNAKTADDRESIQKRIGKLMGGSATVWIGAMTETELEGRKELAKRTASAIRGAVHEGVVSGGGVALLNCRPAIQKLLNQAVNPDERAAYRILLKGLEAPFRTIVANAGHDDREMMAEVKLAGPGYGFDVQSRQVVDMLKAGILDVAAVQRAAARSAISGAALALTIDVVVQHKKPPESYEP